MKQETDYEEAYRKSIEDGTSHRCLKFTVPGRQGYPDRLVLRGLGKMLTQYEREFGIVPDKDFDKTIDKLRRVLAAAIQFTELKKPDGRYQPKQRQIIRELRDMGFKVDVVRGTKVGD